MPYTIPSLTRGEVAAERRRNPRPANCSQCQTGTPVDHWPSTVACRSTFRRDENGTERLARVHCTCDYCF